jgi:peptidoglycan hydrolase CwlO-like protein
LEAEIAELKSKLQEVGMDRDLQQKQVDYYQSELKQIKADF